MACTEAYPVRDTSTDICITGLYLQISQGKRFKKYTLDISMLFWWQIMCKVVNYMASKNASNKIIPDLPDLIEGVAGI